MSPDSVTRPPFPQEYRASGLLLHVTSLPSPYGIGDVGPAAYSWIDRLHEAGQRWWQSLPLGPTGYGNSPYQSLSSFAGNDLLISPDMLIEDELLRPDDCEPFAFPANVVDYDAVMPIKRRLLEAAWVKFSGGARADLRLAFEEFRNTEAHWLEDYALFVALKASSMVRTTSSGPRRWSAASQRRWTGRGASSRIRSVKRALASSCSFARVRGSAHMPGVGAWV